MLCREKQSVRRFLCTNTLLASSSLWLRWMVVLVSIVLEADGRSTACHRFSMARFLTSFWAICLSLVVPYTAE